MKIHGVAGAFVVPNDVFPPEAQEGGETDVEAGRCILGQRGNIFQPITIAPDGLAGGVVSKRDKGQGIILLACRRSKRTRPCISCRRCAGH